VVAKSACEHSPDWAANVIASDKRAFWKQRNYTAMVRFGDRNFPESPPLEQSACARQATSAVRA
jgi:hypothetical protein